MAGILDLVSPEDMMTPQVGKNPMQAFNDHIAFNQFLRDQGNLSRKDYNILGGYDVANRVSPGNPVVGALGNLFGGGAYNLIENFFSKTGTENSPFINDDGSSYNFRTNVTGQPLSEIPGTIFRNALGGSGLISQDLKQKYENLLAEYEGVPANQTNARFTGQNQFQDYPGVENLGGVQNFDLEGVRDIISQMEEEKGNYIERPEDRFNMDGILQNLGGYAKDAAGRYIGSQALGGAGGMLFGPIGGLIGGIAGLVGGGDLFNQNTYSQQMYNNLTSGGKQYADQLYGPGGILQGYNQFSAFGRGTLGTIGNILSKNPNMSMARQGAFRKAADDYISGIDPTQQGINAVTKKGGYGYDDAYINYAPPSGGDSGGGGGSGGETYGSVGSYEDFGTTY
jgi:hypothetical protein